MVNRYLMDTCYLLTLCLYVTDKPMFQGTPGQVGRIDSNRYAREAATREGKRTELTEYSAQSWGVGQRELPGGDIQIDG